ncbi:CLUMA_CG015120, isoform A [Clunio marinus]|uniref:HECT-type E3 ubiquitin transferase n=1 Tax=Clunio marinus TaxID=568069 RepID=A0A1J1IPU2_9DIPT|nr:CLUMA_CG015120, isoform A [Clunio marinus]
MWLRNFEYLDEKWLKCNLNGALKDPYFTRSAIFNTLISDNELSDTKYQSIVNPIGRLSYLRSDGKYYCGGKVLNCSCCEGVCGPTSSCVCDYCQLVPGSLELSEDVQNHQEKANNNATTSESYIESWMWGPIPDDNQLNTCIKKLLAEQRKICLQASDNSLSSFSLKMILKIYERYFVALARTKSKKIAPENRESFFIDVNNLNYDFEIKETKLSKGEKAKVELAKIGSRTALNFFFASLKKAWKSGDTELCGELLSDSLETIQLSLEPGALFDTSNLSPLWMEAIEKSIKFLRQIVLASENESGEIQNQIPKADRNISLNLLLELEMQKGTLAGSLEGVLLLLSVSEINTNQDNRQTPLESNGIPLVKILKRYEEINKNLGILPSTTDQHPFSPTESFLRFLSLPEDDEDEEALIDAQQAAVIIISHLDRICRSHLPSKMWTSRIQNYRNQQIISLGYNGLSPEFNVFSSESEDKWMYEYTRMSNYAAPTIDFGANIVVDQIACAENVIHLLSTSGDVYEVKLQSEQTKAIRIDGFDSNSIINKIISHCEGRHYLALTLVGEIYSWGLGEFGRLGHTEECLSKEHPTKIQYLANKQIINASCGTTYTAVITNNGELYTFGQGRFGKLGHGNSDDKFIPTLVTALKSHKIIDVSCGDSHTLCATDQGKVFVFGDGDFGKLGIGPTNGSQVPILIEGLANISNVYSGPHFSMAVTTDGMSIYTWGRCGRLGHENEVEKVSVGSAHCLLLMSSGELYGFGKNDFSQVCPPCITKDSIIAKPILTTPPFLKISGISCGSTQSIIWSHSSMICIPPKIPFVIDLSEQTFRLLDQLLYCVCGGLNLTTATTSSASETDHPPSQETECIAVASLNLMCLQFHAMICNNISPKKVGLTGARLKSIKSRVLQLSGGNAVLKTIQEAAQNALQIGWSILLPTPSERAQTLTSLLPDPTQASAHRFMTDLLVGSIMAEGGLETALNQIINSERQDCDQLPLLDLLKQLLHNNSTLTQSRLNQLLIESSSKVNDVHSFIDETSSPSIDLLHKFQRLLLSHICSAKHEDLSGAESLLESYIILMSSLCVSTLTKAQDVINQNKEDVALILQSDISDSLLYELLLGMILVQKSRPGFLSSFKWMENFLPLLKTLDNLNRLIYDVEVKNSDHMGWPGIICRDSDNDKLNIISDTEFIRKHDFENSLLDGSRWIIINGCIYDIKDFTASDTESQTFLDNNIGKDLTNELNNLQYQKIFDDITSSNSFLVGKYECESSRKIHKFTNQNYEKLSYFESEKTLAWILGMRSNILQNASSFQPAEVMCKKMLNSIILRGGLQTNITNPFDEEKFEARSSGSTAGSTPTTDGVNLLGEPVQITQFPPMQIRIQSFIYGLAEGRTNDTTVSAWISLSEKFCKENNLIWHQEYSTDHPIIDVDRLLTAVLIRHQSLGTLILAVIDRDMTGINGKIPQPIIEIIKIVHMMKWNLIKIRQQLNRSYKEVCTPILEKCRFLLYEVRPAISPEQAGLKRLFEHYKEPRFRTIVRQIIEDSRVNGNKDTDSDKIDDLLNASIQSTHNSSLSKVAQFVSEHFERHLSSESLHKVDSTEAITNQITSKAPSNENLLTSSDQLNEEINLLEEPSESEFKPSVMMNNTNDEFVNNVILKLNERYNQNEDHLFKSNVNNQIVDFVMQENYDVETLRRAMFCQIQRYQTRKEGLKMFKELLSIENLLDAAKYNIYNGFLNSAYAEENNDNNENYDHILENLNLITAYQKADILIAHSHILEWTIKEFQKYVNQEHFVGKQKWSHGDKDQTNLGTYVFLKKVSRARFLLTIFGLLAKNYTGNELSLLINSGLLGSSLGLLHQTGNNDLPLSNKTDKELSIVYEEDIKLRHNISKDGLLSGPELVKQMKIGTRVARGSDWKWGEQDGNGEGRIISEVGDDGWVRVEWDTGATNSYRMGKEGQYDLRLADSSFKTISPDKESDKNNEELFESKLQQNEIHPTKLLKNACIKLLQMISTSVGVHGDKMQHNAVRVFVTMFYSILTQRNNVSNMGLDAWRTVAFLRGILKSQSISKYITSDLWIKLFFEMLRIPTLSEKDVYKKVQCIRLLQTTLIQWSDDDIYRIDEIVNQLFLLLGNILMNCPHDISLTHLPVGIKTKVLSSASHSGTIAEELISLLRKLHTLPLWNDVINSFISQKMCVAADMFIDTERCENNVYNENLNVAAALSVIGGFDPRPRIGIDLVYDSMKCSIFRMARRVILSVHGSNETLSVSFAKIEKSIEQGIFSLSKLSLNEMLLNSFAVLMYGMNIETATNSPDSCGFDLSLLTYQQIHLASLKATQVLFRHQSLLKTILRQRSPGIAKYSSDDSMSDDSKNAKSDENDEKKSELISNDHQTKQELLVQSILSRAIQSSPLKACFTQSEMEIAALAICQTLAAHFKNNIPQVKFQNVKLATMIHGVAVYNEVIQDISTNNFACSSTSEPSRANPATKLVIQIMEMGFSRKTVELALKQITNRVEILPTAEQVVQWIIDHPESVMDEDSKGTLNKINSFNVVTTIDSDNESTSSENLNSSSFNQQQTRFARRDDFKNGDQYAIYVRSHICPGMLVRCCRDFEEIRAGDVGIVLKVEPDELHDLNVRVDFKTHERPFWMCFVHLEMVEPPSDDIKSSNITYGSHVKIKSSSTIARTQVVKNVVGIVTAVNGLEVIVDFPQQKSWCGQLGDLELVHPASTENELYDIIEDWSQCLKSLTVSSNEGSARNLLERSTAFWQSSNTQGRPWIRLEMRENILIHAMTVRIEPNDCSHQPSTIIIRTGDNLSNLKDFNWVTIRSNDTHVVLLSNVRQYFNWIEIYIKQCRNNGIQCRIHDLYVIGKRKQTDVDAMLSNANFLANDCDTIEPTYSTTYNNYNIDDKSISSRRDSLGGKDEKMSRVYVWGLNDKEQLAGLKGSKVKIPMFSSVLSNLKPIHIAGGSKSLFIVSQDGSLYACGEGTNGRLGLGHNNNVSSPQQVPVINQYIVKKVAVHSGGKHAMAITLDGKIFSWGEGEDGKLGHGNRITLEKPKLIESLKTKRIRDIACGSAHSAAITSQGELYTWGLGEYGRLGHGDNSTLLKPKLVQKLVGQRVVQVACGSRDAQTLCLTEDGTVYSWGDGDFGKLGRGGSDGCSVPQPIDRLNSLGIIQIECGAQFSLALTRTGEVWTWGKGDYYRLGHGSDQHVRKPTPIQCLRGKKIIHVAVGALHCLAVADTGQVYGWGDNDHGQQGSGNTSVNKKPTLVIGLDGVFVNRVACGSSHSIAWSLPDFESELDKKEAVPFTVSKDPLGGHSLGMYSLDDQTTSSPILHKIKHPRKSLSEIVLSLESTSALQIALSNILNAIKILQARSCIIAALTSHAQIKNHQTIFETDKIMKEAKSEDIIELDKQEMMAQANQRDLINSQIANGGGESLAEECENPFEGEMLNDTEYPSNPLPNTSNSLYRSLTNSMSMSAASSCNNAVNARHSKMSTSAMSVMACIINHQEEMIAEVASSKSGLDDFLVLFESSHPYVDDITLVGHVKIPGAEFLRIEFDSQCSTEKRNDPLIIMDSSGRVIATRSGREFAQWAQEIRIPGDEMRWKFTSDNSVNGWGFRFMVHAIMPASYLQELGSDRKILSQPSIDLVMVLLDSKLAPQNPNVLLRLISALSQCAQKGTLSINQRIWCLKKIHYYLTTSRFASHTSDASLMEIIQPLIPMILKQYEYEESQVRTGLHLMHSEYFQCMIALACDLNVDNLLPTNEAHKWSWFKRYCTAVRVAKAMIRRTSLPKSFCFEVRKKLEATTGSAPVNNAPNELSSSMTSSSSYYQSSSLQASIQNENELSEAYEKMPFEDHTIFTLNHDSQLLQWFNRRPEDWAFSWGGGASTIFGWGHNHRGQLGGLDGSRIKIPTPCEALSLLRPIQIVGGEQTLYAVTHDGKVYATGYGAGGRLGIGGADSVAVPTLIESLQHVFIKKVAVNSGGKHCLALSSDNEVFSWGEGEDGKLGHGNRDSYDRPKLIESLSGLGIVDISCGSAHSAAITAEGHVLTWGKGRYGRLGHGDSEDQLKPKVVEMLLGYRAIDIACGSDNVWSWGDGDYGKLGRGGSDGCKVPMKIESLAGLGVIKVECGSQFSVALTRSGSVYTWGKGDYHRLGHGNSEHIRRPKKVAALQGKKIVSIATGSLHCIACTDNGEVFTWGDNDEGQLGDGTVTAIQRPRLVNSLQGKHIVQVICGSAHTLAISTCPHTLAARTLPSPPMEYDLVRDIEPEVLQSRLVLLHHFSELLCPCLAMFSIEGDLSLGSLRDLLVYSIKEASLRKVIQCTMVRDKPHGPTIELNRIQVKRSRNRTGNGLAGIDGMKSVFGQMVQKLPLLTQESLFLPHRIWKVKFVGESVDDCGGGFTIRTGSPLSLNCLAEPCWRQLAGETLRPSDLTEVDRDYVTGLLCIRDMDDDPKIFQTMELPFSTPSAKGHEVFLSTKYTHITPENRQEYVKLALNYRLHEFDEQIKAVRDGMSKVIPVPLLSLFSASELQEMVCGSPDIPLGLLKTVATYKGIDSTSPLVQWFWEVMEEFTNQERSLFLRFVWGRTRLPRSIADFRGRDFVLQVLDKYNPPDHFLPESYTCFFLLKMPRYSCKAVLMEKLKYAIHFCKSIDTDEYARVAMGDPTSHTASEDNSDIESIA